MLTENIVPVFPCRDKANDGDLAGNVLCQPGAGFTSCGVAVKAEEHFSGVLAFRKKTVKGFARNAAQGKIAPCLPVLRVKADKGQKVYRCFKDKELIAVSLIAERIGLVRPGNVLSEWVCRSSHMGVSRRTASVSADKHNIVPLCVLVNIPGKKKSLNKRFVETSAFAKILNCSVGCSVVQGQVERCGRCCGGFGLSLAVFACQHLNSFGKGLAVKLHDEINGIAALALAVAKPLVSPDGQAVMFFPTVFPSAFDKCLSLCAEKIFQTDGVCPVNLCLGVIHRDSSSFFCRVWGRFWSFCSSVRSLNRAAVSTHDLTFQRRCKSSLTALNSP